MQPTQDAAYTTAGVSYEAINSDRALAVGGESIYDLLDSVVMKLIYARTLEVPQQPRQP